MRHHLSSCRRCSGGGQDSSEASTTQGGLTALNSSKEFMVSGHALEKLRRSDGEIVHPSSPAFEIVEALTPSGEAQLREKAPHNEQVPAQSTTSQDVEEHPDPFRKAQDSNMRRSEKSCSAVCNQNDDNDLLSVKQILASSK